MDGRETNICLILFILSVLMLFPIIVESKQMCWSCQYVLKGAGKEECAVAPANWSGGETRIKCSAKCIITAEFDVVTGDPTFIHRGCGDSMQQDGCVENGDRHACFFSCVDKNYCNDKKLPKSPMVADFNRALQLGPSYTSLLFLSMVLCVWIVRIV